MTSKVFIIQDNFGNRDYSSASNYGAIHFLLDAEDSPSRMPSACLQTIAKKLREGFNPEEDYLVWSGGDPLANLITGIVLGVSRVPKIKFLRWEKKRDLEGNKIDSKSGYYTPVEIKCY